MPVRTNTRSPELHPLHGPEAQGPTISTNLIDAEQATLPVIGESRLEERLDKVLMRAE
jgi:hypothetical protein